MGFYRDSCESYVEWVESDTITGASQQVPEGIVLVEVFEGHHTGRLTSEEDPKYYKTTFMVEVLSEGKPFPDAASLHNIAYAIEEGDCSGVTKMVSQKELTGKQAAKALKAQGSDPGFFDLDEDGNKLQD